MTKREGGYENYRIFGPFWGNIREKVCRHYNYGIYKYLEVNTFCLLSFTPKDCREIL